MDINSLFNEALLAQAAYATGLTNKTKGVRSFFLLFGSSEII